MSTSITSYRREAEMLRNTLSNRDIELAARDREIARLSEQTVILGKRVETAEAQLAVVTRNSAPHPAPDALSPSDASGEPHTEAGAGDGMEAPALSQLIDLIGELGREVYYLLDDCETSGPVGGEIHTITGEGLDKVSEILDRIDDLPHEEPGVILGTGAKLQVALEQEIAAQLAAMTAERDALDTRCRMITSHATMGHTDGEGLSVNQISVQITGLRNELYQDAKAKGREEGVEEYWRLTFNGMSPHEAKRTALAAAEKEAGK